MTKSSASGMKLKLELAFDAPLATLLRGSALCIPAALGLSLFAAVAAAEPGVHPDVGSGDHFYHGECCSEQDCYPAPASRIRFDGSTYWVTLGSGRVAIMPVIDPITKGPNSALRWVPESHRGKEYGDQFHICESGQELLCLYRPWPTF